MSVRLLEEAYKHASAARACLELIPRSEVVISGVSWYLPVRELEEVRYRLQQVLAQLGGARG